MRKRMALFFQDGPMHERLRGRGLYVITDGPRPNLLEVVALALAGGLLLIPAVILLGERRRGATGASTANPSEG